MPSTLRFLREFVRPRPGSVVREETTYLREGERLPATLYRPPALDPSLPGWMTLHGLTYRGREHPSLRRFARALAASGVVVLVPDLPEWRALRVAPATTVATIRAAVLELDSRGLTEPGRIGVMGFSFGATQALIAASDPALDGHLAGVAAWGGYADMHRLARFLFLGPDSIGNGLDRVDPDPYGRWILGGNYLPLLPEHADDQPLADALRGLALEAGRRGIMSWEPAMDPHKERARASLSPAQQALFDLLAPPAGAAPGPRQRERIAELVDRLSAAALEHEPLLDPSPFLARVPVPVFLAHGVGDRLIPWTEWRHLRDALPPERIDFAGVTTLFSHSFGERRFPTPRLAWDAARFVRLIHRMIHLV